MSRSIWCGLIAFVICGATGMTPPAALIVTLVASVIAALPGM